MNQSSLRHYTNTVLVLNEQNKKTLFLPAYLRVAFKKLTQVDVQGNSGQMSATVILTLYYKGLSRSTLDYIKKNLAIAVNNQMFFTLDPNQQRNPEDGKVTAFQDDINGEYSIQWRNKFLLEMNCDVFWTPFQLISLSVNFAIRSISWNYGNTKMTVKTNFMDSPNQDLVTKFSLQDNQDFGEYGLAESSVCAKYKKSLKEQDNKDEQKLQKGIKNKIMPGKNKNDQSLAESPLKTSKQEPIQTGKNLQNWQYAQFSLAVYRYPFTTILMVLLPLILLAVINLAIFFTDFSFSGRIANIATLMVAYSAFLPTIRESIPPSPNMTMFDLILYGLLMTSILCLIRSWIDREKGSEYQYIWQEDPLFIISLILVSFSVFIGAICLTLHKLVWEKRYNEGEGRFKHKGKLFKSSEWSNKKCDTEFLNAKKEGAHLIQLSPSEVVDFYSSQQTFAKHETHKRPLPPPDVMSKPNQIQVNRKPDIISTQTHLL